MRVCELERVLCLTGSVAPGICHVSYAEKKRNPKGFLGSHLNGAAEAADKAEPLF